MTDALFESELFGHVRGASPAPSCNRYGTRMVVLPITSNVDSLYPGEARVEAKGKPGRALRDQIRSVDKTRLGARGDTNTCRDGQDDEAVAIALALRS